MRQFGGRNPDLMAGRLKILGEIFIATDVIHDQVAMQINQIIVLYHGGHIGVILGWPRRLEFPAQEGGEVRNLDHQIRSLSPDVMIGTDLQIPGIANEGELKELLIEVERQHLQGGNSLGMAWKFGADTMPCQAADLAAEKLGKPIGIGPFVPAEGIAHARAARLGDMNEKKAVFQRQQHDPGPTDAR